MTTELGACNYSFILNEHIVDENGMATFTFTHASDYILAITDEEYTGQELNPKPVETPAPTEAPTATPATETLPTEPTLEPQQESPATPTVEEAFPTPGVNDASTDTASSNATTTTTPSNIYIWIIISIILLIVGSIITILFIKQKK